MEKAIFFFELHGENSFAGFQPEDKNPTVTLIDASVHPSGFLEPGVFLDVFKYVDHARLLYQGKADTVFTNKVRTGQLKRMTFEGVVCKGKCVSPGLPLMFKIKNQAWIGKLKEKCGDNTEMFKELV